MSKLYNCENCKHKDTGYKGCNKCIDVSDRPDSIPSHWRQSDMGAFAEQLFEHCKPEDKMVYHPDHYQSKSGLEVIQVMEAFTEGLEGIEAVDTGNVIKYICRWKKKNGLQDLKKACWYLNDLINHVEKENE